MLVQKVLLPELGEGISQATVACWHVKVGQQVAADDDLVELVTDKATFCVPAPGNGMVSAILASEGQSVAIGQPLATIR
jgi:pyruvate/2-oxoglutarate dehydrogenase complex dihydrolipoamide acyltransferase (E2) component